MLATDSIDPMVKDFFFSIDRAGRKRQTDHDRQNGQEWIDRI
jgi:hypothetical protein